ncbi:proteinase-activated receptor 1 isoform X3 [Protopterus annectens]|uniref:proteinase-activated receptor 1 isoform X3 n=1 Tax=Protopterus annectens TaxID=7888 RepID=UPI001CFA859E|nr:proteinase-activated receptor 1 isoform X3 [Protopterus annectens]
MAFCGALILLIVPFLCAAADADTNGTVKNVNDSENNGLKPRMFLISTNALSFNTYITDYEEDNSTAEMGSGFNIFASPRRRGKILGNHTEHDLETYLTSPWMIIFIPSVYSFVVSMTLPLNCLAVIVILYKIKLKTPTVIYMLNLAIADVLFAILLTFKICYHFSGNDWHFGPGLCRIVTAAFYCNMYCSVLLITCISVDRFLAVVYPVRSRSWRSTKHATLVCISTWIVAAAGTTPLVLKEQTLKVPGLNITTCHDVSHEFEMQNFYMYYYPLFSLFFFCIPFLITVFCYSVTIHRLSDVSVSVSSKKTRAIFLTAAVLFVFVVCFAPTNILLSVHYLRFSREHNSSTYFAYLLSVCIGSLNCCIDPIIYYYGSSQWKESLYNLVCCVDTQTADSSTSLSGTATAKTSNTSCHLNSSIYRKLLT